MNWRWLFDNTEYLQLKQVIVPIMVVCTLKVEFNFYDIRHWNERGG
jgi:hypothetical protein